MDGGAGGLVTALALFDAGRADEAGRALDAWAATLTRSDLAAWGRSLAAGAPTALPLAAPDAGDYGILAAPGARDLPLSFASPSTTSSAQVVTRLKTIVSPSASGIT